MHVLCFKYNAPKIVRLFFLFKTVMEYIRICVKRKYINVVSLFILRRCP